VPPPPRRKSMGGKSRPQDLTIKEAGNGRKAKKGTQKEGASNGWGGQNSPGTGGSVRKTGEKRNGLKRQENLPTSATARKEKSRAKKKHQRQKVSKEKRKATKGRLTKKWKVQTKNCK